MSKEKVILSAFAVLLGLLLSALGFYIYQGAKYTPSTLKDLTIKSIPTPKPSIYLTVTEPKDEAVFEKKVIEVSGKTVKDALIVILTEDSEEVVSPTEMGDFSTTITLEGGENFIQITAIAPNGESLTVDRTVTYSTESF